MRLYLVPCNALSNGNQVAEDRGLIYAHAVVSRYVLPQRLGGVTRTCDAMKLYLTTWPPEKQIEQTVGQRSAQEEAMRLHLAERDPQHHALPKRGVEDKAMKLRILLSYHYYKDTDLDALFSKYFTEPYPSVFADSGAFSAFTQGVPIALDEYATWIKRYAHLFDVYGNLDVIGDAEGTLTNQKRLEDYGLAPLPVFHTGEDWAYLERYIDQYPYMALGGMVPYMRQTNVIMPWIIRCFKMAQGRTVFHGFGATSWQVITSMPWYSVDSSSWGQGFRFGTVPVFDSVKGGFLKLDLGSSIWFKHGRLIRSLGFDPQDFADRDRNDRAKICAISALSYMKAEQWLRGKHGPVTIPDRDAPDGLRAHLVTAGGIGSNHSIPTIVDSLAEYGAGERLHLSDTSNGINYRDADTGIKCHLVDTQNLGDIRRVVGEINEHHRDC